MGCRDGARVGKKLRGLRNQKWCELKLREHPKGLHAAVFIATVMQTPPKKARLSHLNQIIFSHYRKTTVQPPTNQKWSNMITTYQQT